MKRLMYILVIIFSVFLISSTIQAYTEYKIGDEVEYNGIDFYVIKDSSSEKDTVTMLKAEPLSYEEIQEYAEGIDVKITNQNGYGKVQYGISTDYSTSTVKQVVDAWKNSAVASGDTATARLITIDELVDNFNYEPYAQSPSENYYRVSEYTPSWVYNSNYSYWTMSQYQDSSNVWLVYDIGNLNFRDPSDSYMVRPVITLSKTVLGDKDESVIEEDVNDKENNIEDDKQIIPDKQDNSKQESITKVKVENTYMSQSIIIIILGFIIGCASLTLYYIIRKKEGK